MGKCKDLNDYDTGQIVIARRLEQSVTKTTGLVGVPGMEQLLPTKRGSRKDNWPGAYTSLTWGREVAPGCTMGRSQAGRDSAMLCYAGKPLVLKFMWRCYFDTYHLPEHWCRPRHLHGHTAKIVQE
ncbi:hypothetical protein QTP70_032466 [Hemibagrus guttatus]|uniref:Uncharacterized protein n=1 Tax=Hemibagrus guttatus TaxID=175788 RepID=A0AAE0R4M1_9TELE|nr:hypothetical protein QTP70_032466 [Hemibagrus guttatus]